MNVLFQLMLPELILIAAACVLILMGVSHRVGTRQVVPWIALATLIGVFLFQATRQPLGDTLTDPWGTLRIFEFQQFIKMLAAGVGVLLVLLAWPTNPQATGNSALDYGTDAGEFLGLMLLSLSGIFIVAGANDIILLFLGIELASLPTYVMVSISRPRADAQEAGVKYFFLSAMSAAIMLFGFSYMYGATGTTNLYEITGMVRHGFVPGQAVELSPWLMLAVVMVLAGLCFKIAAVPLHFYVGDVYQGTSTAVTAFLAFVPKTAGFVAVIKVLFLAGGGGWALPQPIVVLLWVLAALTMTVGNLLGLLQFNVKRILAYSSIAHSGYILVGLTALVAAAGVHHEALRGVLFYLAAYGIMNTGAFAVLMLLPSREGGIATSAETFEDLAGQGRRHVGLGLAMAVTCFSLIGLPLTVGFFGKLYLIKPALDAGGPWMIGLVIITMINVAISAAYYLRIVATMFLRAEPAPVTGELTSGAVRSPMQTVEQTMRARPIWACVLLSALGTLFFGMILPATEMLTTRIEQAAVLEGRPVDPIAPVAGATELPAP